MQATINDSLAEWRDIRLRAENVLSRLTSQEDMTDRFRKLIGLSSTAEFNAELAKMSPKELFAFKQWVQHDIDQKDAGTLQHKENAALAEQAAQVLESYGFGQPGKETLEDVMHLLSKEEQLLVTEVLARMRST
jgi:hypothetical protein